MRLIKRILCAVLMPLAVTGCVTSPPIYASKSPCSDLLPSAWRSGVPHAPPPGKANDALTIAREWTKFAVAQTGQLKKANERYEAAVGIVERCEERDKEAIDRAKPKFLGVF